MRLLRPGVNVGCHYKFSFTTKITKDTKLGIKNSPNFVRFVSFVVNLSCHDILE